MISAAIRMKWDMPSQEKDAKGWSSVIHFCQMSRRPFPNLVVNCEFLIYPWSVLKIPHTETDRSLISYGQSNQYIM